MSTSRLIAVADAKYPRYSEGDVIELPDGRLLLAVGRKGGADDFAVGTIIGQFSRDGGLTWDDEPHPIQGAFADVKDVMSVSLVRTPRGLHLFFLGRGPQAEQDTRIYQLLSKDDGRTWSDPVRVSTREGYHIVNNARVVRLKSGRLVVPCAFVPGSIGKLFEQQRIFCLLSDDDGQTWRQSGELAIENKPLMEPGVVECADGSVYMTIRTAMGHLWEARSADGGATWADLRATALTSPAAPSTVARDPANANLWMLWFNRRGGSWPDRNPLAVAISADHGKTWGPPRNLETDTTKSFGYVSVTVVRQHVLLTYYDWKNAGQPNFHLTSLRQRLIPIQWFRAQPVPPVFRTSPTPVLKQDQPWEGGIISANSGLLVDKDRWRLWYTAGTLGPRGEQLRICYAESADAGLTWRKPPRPVSPEPNTNVVFPLKGDTSSCYHASVHRDGDQLAAYVWRRTGEGLGLFRYISRDDGASFALDPARPIMAHPFAGAGLRAQAGEGRVSNDASDMIRNDNGAWEYFAAYLVKAQDPRTIIKHDNAAGWLRHIARATSPDGVRWSPTRLILQPQHDAGDPWDQQFYGLQVLRYRRFYLGLLHTYYVDSQVIQPEWAWSHDGQNWTRTRTPCIPLGDEGAFDCRMIVFGSLAWSGDDLVWLYSGYPWRHNAFKNTPVTAAIGRATLPKRDLDNWLDTLPQP